MTLLAMQTGVKQWMKNMTHLWRIKHCTWFRSPPVT
jgi:hypothetical protein